MQELNIIKSFLIKECSIAINPIDVSDTYKFPNIDELIDVFFLLLQFKSTESSLQQTGSTILPAIVFFASNKLEVEKMNQAIVSLSIGFESFLKIIAEIKYNEREPIKFKGDGINYKGIISTTLGKMLEGKVSKINPNDHAIAVLSAPLVTFSYSSPFIRDQIYLKIRDVRNEVHAAPERTLSASINIIKTCISAYLFAVFENISLIRQSIDPVFKHLILIRESFKKVGEHFVDLESEKAEFNSNTELPSLDALEWLDDEPINNKKRIQLNENPLVQKSPVTKILERNDCIWLIGEPGSGKTTSLQVCVLKLVDIILQHGIIGLDKIPVFISARLIKEEYSLRHHIMEFLKVNETELDVLLLNDNLKIVIDGINEMSTQLQLKIQNELQSLINEYPDISIIISSRRYGFSRSLNFPIFELLPLSLLQIEEYIRKYISNSCDAENLINQLKQADDLIIDFAKNPLLLRMLIQVGITEQIQSNFGLLFEKFINWIFEREKRKGCQINSLLKEYLLAELAYSMRSISKRVIDQDDFITSINKSIAKWNETLSPIKFLDEVLANRILIQTADKQISFFHELVLEYFTAVYLKRVYSQDTHLVIELANKFEWHESIIILSGIINHPDILIKDLGTNNLVLAARCISSGCKISSETVSVIFNDCKTRLEFEEKKEYETITALLELATADSFRLVVKHLASRKHSFTSALSRCQRPEVIATKLLNFGLTGKHRIRQCLKVFIDRPNSASFIHSKTIADAQIILMSGKIELEDVNLINKLGISDGALNHISIRINKLINTKEIHSPIFISACEFASNRIQSFDNAIISTIKTKFESLATSSDTGEKLYRCFRLALTLRKYIDIVELIELLIKKMFSLKYYNLLLKYLDTFKELSLTITYLDEVIQSLIQDGKLQLLLSYKKSFKGSVSDDNLLMAYKNGLTKKFSPEFLHAILEINEILGPKEEKLLFRYLSKLIKENSLHVNFIIKWIKRLNIQNQFVDIALITKLTKTKSGFANYLLNGEQYYFKFGAFSGDESFIQVGKLIQMIKIDQNPIVPNIEAKKVRPRIIAFHFFDEL